MTYKDKIFEDLRISDCTQKTQTYAGKHKYQLVREYAKRVAQKATEDMVCAVCGYKKHVEVCHIKPISSFPTDAKLSEVNADSNLVLLCPNCHWEFDNGLLDICS